MARKDSYYYSVKSIIIQLYAVKIAYNTIMQSFSIFRSAHIIMALGWADFLLKYRGSILGYIWSFIVPFVKFLVIFHIFRPFVSDIPQYPLYLFLGLILWEHFAMTTTACIQMPQDKSAIISKIAFPRILLMLSVGWTHFIILCTYFVIFLGAVVILGAKIPLNILWYFPLLLGQASCISLGVGMILGAYALRFRDIQHLWTVVLQILFWLTPIMYAYKPTAPLMVDASRLLQNHISLSLWHFFDIFIRFQPLSILIHDARRALLYPELLGTPTLFHILFFSGACIMLFYIGMIIFKKRSPYFIQEY